VQEPCLELVNTVEPRIGPVLRDALTDYAALAGWAVRADLLPDRSAERLCEAACADPAAAERALREAIELREALFGMFGALAWGRRPEPQPVDTVRRHYVDACRSATVHIAPGVVRWRWAADDLAQIARRVAMNAIAVAGTAGDRLRQCPPADGGCGWLFVDRTKNGSRRWCSMADCGGTAKARRQAARRRAAGAAAPA
jgi:predicted RNA-binding Zn ribbon-like protein